MDVYADVDVIRDANADVDVDIYGYVDVDDVSVKGCSWIWI